jgi:hypothetical protein
VAGPGELSREELIGLVRDQAATIAQLREANTALREVNAALEQRCGGWNGKSQGTAGTRPCHPPVMIFQAGRSLPRSGLSEPDSGRRSRVG